MRAAIDTHAFIKQITAVGMPEPQAEVLARALSERPGKSAVIEAVQKSTVDINKRIEAVEGRINERLSGIETLLVKILEGQSVLHQNDMELKRRLDKGASVETADSPKT
jgi:hypothetical protein